MRVRCSAHVPTREADGDARDNLPRALQGDNAMPRRWTDKDERKYEHIKEGELKRGVNVRRAKEIAARTVNKSRREEGRTENQRTQGTGNPNTSLKERSKEELMNRARQMGIAGRSRMTKTELVRAIQTH
jgi:plasmid stabilization system protein ParE